MTDHLPECPMLDERYPKHPLEKCDYCEMLRACEQRVTDEIWGAIREGSQYKSGFEGGLDAAREAVWDSVGPSADAFSQMVLGRALAAIDALRGES